MLMMMAKEEREKRRLSEKDEHIGPLLLTISGRYRTEFSGRS